MQTRINSLTRWAFLHWFASFVFLYGLFIGLPFLAPVFMHIKWELAGKVIYFIYSFLCHQLPERSYFLFGPALNYPLKAIQLVWTNTDNLLILRQFIGNPSMGWKIAWSDRMVSMYSSVWVFALLWFPFRRKVSSLPWWGLGLLLLPMALDGGTHFISDLQGFGQGFRDTNLWLAALTNNALGSNFYAGDAWNSFNGLMRLLTGLLFGFGVVWFLFPYLEVEFLGLVRPLENRLVEGNSSRPTWWLLSGLVIFLFAIGCAIICFVMGRLF